MADDQRGARTGHFHVCRHCGVRPFARGFLPALGDCVTVQLGTLDDVDAAALAAAPIRFADGANDQWHAPSDDVGSTFAATFIDVSGGIHMRVSGRGRWDRGIAPARPGRSAGTRSLAAAAPA
jgi:hypothetical protein